jgi:hypothetical protein
LRSSLTMIKTVTNILNPTKTLENKQQNQQFR